MAIHFGDEKLKLLLRAFGARYTDGYMFLSRSGDLLTRLRKEHPAWVVQSLTHQQVNLQHTELSLRASISTASIEVTGIKPLSVKAGGETCRNMAEQSELLYTLVIETLNVSFSHRVGFQCNWLAPTDSVEEADRFVCGTLRSPYERKVAEALRMELADGTSFLQYEDSQTGIRRGIQTTSIAQVPVGSLEPEGFPVEGSGGILVTVDTYFRPESGHATKLNLFIQEQYNQSYTTVRELCRWLVSTPKVDDGRINRTDGDAPLG